MSRRTLYQGRFLDLGMERATLPDGQEVELEIIRHPGAAAVVPLHEDGTVTLIRQYRHAGGGMILEIPAGKLDDDEEPTTCAARELMEEAGLAAGRLEPLGSVLTTPAFTDECIHLYLARALSPAPQALEAGEYIELVRVSLDEALAMADDGRIRDGKTICALFRAERHLARS